MILFTNTRHIAFGLLKTSPLILLAALSWALALVPVCSEKITLRADYTAAHLDGYANFSGTVSFEGQVSAWAKYAKISNASAGAALEDALRASLAGPLPGEKTGFETNDWAHTLEVNAQASLNDKFGGSWKSSSHVESLLPTDDQATR